MILSYEHDEETTDFGISVDGEKKDIGWNGIWFHYSGNASSFMGFDIKLVFSFQVTVIIGFGNMYGVEDCRHWRESYQERQSSRFGCRSCSSQGNPQIYGLQFFSHVLVLRKKYFFFGIGV